MSNERQETVADIVREIEGGETMIHILQEGARENFIRLFLKNDTSNNANNDMPTDNKPATIALKARWRLPSCRQNNGEPNTRTQRGSYMGKRRVDNPLSHWSDGDWDALWCALFNGSVIGNNDNRNRAHILRHYCNISDKAKMNFYGLNRKAK